MSDTLSFRVHGITITFCLMSADELCPYYGKVETREQLTLLYVRIERISRGHWCVCVCVCIYEIRETITGIPAYACVLYVMLMLMHISPLTTLTFVCLFVCFGWCFYRQVFMHPIMGKTACYHTVKKNILSCTPRVPAAP